MRTFIAIDLPTFVQEQMHKLQQQLQADIRPFGGDRLLKWTTPGKVHVTLRFLGETSEEQTQRLKVDLHRIVAETDPFVLRIGGIGVFPSWPRIRVLWTGVSGELSALHRLQQAVETAAQAAGFSAEDKSFSPHITLARMKNESSKEDVRRVGDFLRAWSQQEGSTVQTEWRVGEIVHMQSTLQPSGAVYTPIERFIF